MHSQIIKCPFCGKQFRLTTENPSALVDKNFRCTNCNHNVSLAQVLHLPNTTPFADAASLPTQADQSNASRTHLLNEGAKHNVILNILSTGDRIGLPEGQYTIGRRSSDSTAMVQLAPDPYMSRLHAKMAAKAIGGKLVAQVCSVKSGNPVFLNGQACLVNKPYNLRSGDRLQMGNTQIVVTLS